MRDFIFYFGLGLINADSVLAQKVLAEWDEPEYPRVDFRHLRRDRMVSVGARTLANDYDLPFAEWLKILHRNPARARVVWGSEHDLYDLTDILYEDSDGNHHPCWRFGVGEPQTGISAIMELSSGGEPRRYMLEWEEIVHNSTDCYLFREIEFIPNTIASPLASAVDAYSQTLRDASAFVKPVYPNVRPELQRSLFCIQYPMNSREEVDARLTSALSQWAKQEGLDSQWIENTAAIMRQNLKSLGPFWKLQWPALQMRALFGLMMYYDIEDDLDEPSNFYPATEYDEEEFDLKVLAVREAYQALQAALF